jgi:hypothetical protein
MARRGIRLLLVRWKTASWWRRAGLSTCSEVRVRRVEVNPASSDIDTAPMTQDDSSAKPQRQPFQSVRNFWQGQAGKET